MGGAGAVGSSRWLPQSLAAEGRALSTTEEKPFRIAHKAYVPRACVEGCPGPLDGLRAGRCRNDSAKPHGDHGGPCPPACRFRIALWRPAGGSRVPRCLRRSPLVQHAVVGFRIPRHLGAIRRRHARKLRGAFPEGRVPRPLRRCTGPIRILSRPIGPSARQLRFQRQFRFPRQFGFPGQLGCAWSVRPGTRAIRDIPRPIRRRARQFPRQLQCSPGPGTIRVVPRPIR